MFYLNACIPKILTGNIHSGTLCSIKHIIRNTQLFVKVFYGYSLIITCNDAEMNFDQMHIDATKIQKIF